jgi:hypothetical protein
MDSTDKEKTHMDFQDSEFSRISDGSAVEATSATRNCRHCRYHPGAWLRMESVRGVHHEAYCRKVKRTTRPDGICSRWTEQGKVKNDND